MIGLACEWAVFAIFDGMNSVNMLREKSRDEQAPMCHFRKMFYDQSDVTDGYYEEWWECSVCGHTKQI